jgi:hypothetical protein
MLVGLADGQELFAERGGRPTGILGDALCRLRLSDGSQLWIHGTDSETIERYTTLIKPEKGPRALGPVPRLGIGTRMSTMVWPGIFSAMRVHRFSSNAIQNSLRELNLLDDLLQARPARTNHLFGFGTIEEGHTGSTFEGLWVYGVLQALKTAGVSKYGADADHIMIKRGPDPGPGSGPDALTRAKEICEAARRYSFFTVDLSDILNYAALLHRNGGPAPDGHLSAGPVNAEHETGVPGNTLEFHSRRRRMGGVEYTPDASYLAMLSKKYGQAFDALQQLYTHIVGLKQDQEFDLELSIDEQPSGLDTFSCLTSETELIFILLELERRAIPVTHVAPNVGIEKGTDYRGSGGLKELEHRVEVLYRIADAFGVLLDFHSGDDLSAETRRVLGRACGGRLHFKISPSLQLLLAEVLSEIHPDLFGFWYDDTLSYARREAESGSPLAGRCIEECEASAGGPSVRDAVFHHFSFATVGRRDRSGKFLNRELFYDLSEECSQEYAVRVERYLGTLADDLFSD